MGFGVVMLHSNKWQKKDEASFNGKRGALARNWLTGSRRCLRHRRVLGAAR